MKRFSLLILVVVVAATDAANAYEEFPCSNLWLRPNSQFDLCNCVIPKDRQIFQFQLDPAFESLPEQNAILNGINAWAGGPDSYLPSVALRFQETVWGSGPEGGKPAHRKPGGIPIVDGGPGGAGQEPTKQFQLSFADANNTVTRMTTAEFRALGWERAGPRDALTGIAYKHKNVRRTPRGGIRFLDNECDYKGWDVVFFEDRSWEAHAVSERPENTNAYENGMAHELGHVLHLAHPDPTTATPGGIMLGKHPSNGEYGAWMDELGTRRLGAGYVSIGEDEYLWLLEVHDGRNAWIEHGTAELNLALTTWGPTPDGKSTADSWHEDVDIPDICPGDTIAGIPAGPWAIMLGSVPGDRRDGLRNNEDQKEGKEQGEAGLDLGIDVVLNQKHPKLNDVPVDFAMVLKDVEMSRGTIVVPMQSPVYDLELDGVHQEVSDPTWKSPESALVHGANYFIRASINPSQSIEEKTYRDNMVLSGFTVHIDSESDCEEEDPEEASEVPF